MKKGLSSNCLKIIAIIIMIIDHIAAYMNQSFGQGTYYLLRNIRKNSNANICIFNCTRIFLH